MDKLTSSLETNHICEELQRSVFFNIIKFPTVYLSISGIYVPHFCARNACSTRDNIKITIPNSDQERQELELTDVCEYNANKTFSSPVVNVTSHNFIAHKLNNELITKDCLIIQSSRAVKPEDEERVKDDMRLKSGADRERVKDNIRIKSESGRERVKDGARRVKNGLKSNCAAGRSSTGFKKTTVTYLKIAFCCIYVTVELLDICRLMYIISMIFPAHKEFVTLLTNITFRLFVIFLNLTSSFANYNHFRPTCCAWLEYERKYGLKTDLKISEKRTRIVIAIGIFTNIAIFVTLFLGILTSLHELGLQVWPLNTNTPFSKGAGAAISATLGFFGSCDTISAHIFRATLISALVKEFQHLRGRLGEILSEPLMHAQVEEEFVMAMDQLRLIKEVTHKTFQLVKHTIAAAYIFTPVLLCLVLYNVTAGKLVWNQTLLTMYTVVTSLLMITGTTFLCAQLQSEARSVWGAVYKAPWCRLSPAMLQKLCIFTSQLSVDDVSCSVYGMFTVDYSSLLMVGGTVLTYGILVLQLTLDKR